MRPIDIDWVMAHVMLNTISPAGIPRAQYTLRCNVVKRPTTARVIAALMIFLTSTNEPVTLNLYP